jgi:hypothetical protein
VKAVACFEGRIGDDLATDGVFGIDRAIMAVLAGPALADCKTPPTTSSTTEMTEDFPMPVRPFVSAICSKNRGAGAAPLGLGEICTSAT